MCISLVHLVWFAAVLPGDGESDKAFSCDPLRTWRLQMPRGLPIQRLEFIWFTESQNDSVRSTFTDEARPPIARSIYVDRTSGGYRHHCDFSGAFVARVKQREGTRSQDLLFQQ